MDSNDSVTGAEEVAPTVRWYEWLALGWQSVGVSVGLGLLGWVVAFKSDGKTGAYVAGVLASIATALLLVGVLFGIQEQLKMRLLEAVQRAIEHQERQIAARFDQQREYFRKVMKRLDERASEVRAESRSRDASSAPDSSSSSDEAGDGDDDPPDVTSRGPERKRPALRFPFQDWLDEHVASVQRAITVMFLVGSGTLFAATLVDAIGSLPTSTPGQTLKGVESARDSGSTRDHTDRSNDHATKNSPHASDEHVSADPDRSTWAGDPVVPPRPPSTDMPGYNTFAHRRRAAIRAGRARLRRLNRVMRHEGSCRLIPHRSVPAQAAEACGTSPTLLVVFAFRSPSAAERYYRRKLANRRSRDWDCVPVRVLSRDTQSRWWWYDARPGRLLMSGDARNSPWRGIVLEC